MFCEVCKKEIPNNKGAIRIARKILFDDGDEGVWWNFKKAYICSNCLGELQEKIARSISSRN